MKYFVWIEKLKSIRNTSIFFEVFQLVKLVEIQLPSKQVKFEILLTQPYTLDSLVELSIWPSP